MGVYVVRIGTSKVGMACLKEVDPLVHLGSKFLQ